MDRRVELKNEQKETLGSVVDYEKFCELIFGLKDPSDVKCEIKNIYFGDKPSISRVNKVDFLERTIYDGEEITSLMVLDDEGNKYDILNIAKNINPDAIGGVGCICGLEASERRRIIESVWLADSCRRAEDLAARLGGVCVPLNNFDFKSGLHSAIFFVDQENNQPKINIFRGIREISEDALNRQVCGMLRLSNSLNPEIIEDEKLWLLVSNLAEQPDQINLEKVAKRYKELGLLNMEDTAKMVLKSISGKMTRQGIDFEEAMEDVHTELYSGVVGGSPYLATTTHMEKTVNFTGSMGAIMVIRPTEGVVKVPKRRGEEEIYVKVKADRSDMVALVPINRVVKVDNEDWNEIGNKFSMAEGEILQCLDIFYKS